MSIKELAKKAKEREEEYQEKYQEAHQKEVNRRLSYAINPVADILFWVAFTLSFTIGTTIAFFAGMYFQSFTLAIVVFFFFAAISTAYAIHQKIAKKKAIREAINYPNTLPFSVKNFQEYLAGLNNNGILKLSKAPPKELSDAIKAISPESSVKIEKTTVQISPMPIRYLFGTTDIGNVEFGGNIKIFKEFAEQILLPLHKECGIKELVFE